MLISWRLSVNTFQVTRIGDSKCILDLLFVERPLFENWEMAHHFVRWVTESSAHLFYFFFFVVNVAWYFLCFHSRKNFKNAWRHFVINAQYPLLYLTCSQRVLRTRCLSTTLDVNVVYVNCIVLISMNLTRLKLLAMRTWSHLVYLRETESFMLQKYHAWH